MKKIILGGLILSSLFVGFTKAVIFTPNETINNNGVSITCDEYFNCTSTYNSNTYNGIFPGKQGNYLGLAFWNGNELGLIFGYTTNASLLQKVFSGSFTKSTYEGMLTYTQNVCDYLPSKTTLPYETYISDYAGKKITKYMINGNAVNSCICAGYENTNESICFLMYGYNTVGDDKNRGIASGPITEEKLLSVQTTLSPLTAGGPDTEGGPISCINIKTEIMLYGANYNTGLCYTNGIEFSGNQIINTGKLSIFEVYPTYQDYKEALNLYNTYCLSTSPSTPEYCQQVMQGHQPEYTWQFANSIKNINSNMIFTATTEKLYQYCHLELNFTEEEKRTECKDTVENYYATGITAESNANGNPFEGISDRVDNNMQIAVPTTGTVFDEFLDGDTRIVGITDRYDNFKDIYHKIMGLFKYRNTQQGIIPGYITAMLMLILLLAIIKK